MILDIQKTNVPTIRLSYRYQTLMEERYMVLGSLRKTSEEADSEKDELEPLPMSKIPSMIPEENSKALTDSIGRKEVSDTSPTSEEPLGPSLERLDLSKDGRSRASSRTRVLSNPIAPEPLLHTVDATLSPRRTFMLSPNDVNAPFLALNPPMLPVIENEQEAGILLSRNSRSTGTKSTKMEEDKGEPWELHSP